MSGIDTILPHSAINQNYSSYSEISTGNKDSDVTGLSESFCTYIFLEKNLDEFLIEILFLFV